MTCAVFVAAMAGLAWAATDEGIVRLSHLHTTSVERAAVMTALAVVVMEKRLAELRWTSAVFVAVRICRVSIASV
jgi:hypothetical protein